MGRLSYRAMVWLGALALLLVLLLWALGSGLGGLL